MIEIHTLEGPEYYEVVIAVDTDIADEKLWEDLSSFWSSHKARKREGCKRKMLEMLANTCFEVQVGNDYNSFGVMNAFEDREGWCRMDGSMGILIVSVDIIEFDSRLLDTKIQKTMPKPPTGNM